MPKIGWDEMVRRDMQLLSLLENKSTKEVATMLRKDVAAIRVWIYRIRERRRKMQRYLNMQNSLMKRSPRVRKMLLSSKIAEEEII